MKGSVSRPRGSFSTSHSGLARCRGRRAGADDGAVTNPARRDQVTAAEGKSRPKVRTDGGVPAASRRRRPRARMDPLSSARRVGRAADRFSKAGQVAASKFRPRSSLRPSAGTGAGGARRHWAVSSQTTDGQRGSDAKLRTKFLSQLFWSHRACRKIHQGVCGGPMPLQGSQLSPV